MITAVWLACGLVTGMLLAAACTLSRNQTVTSLVRLAGMMSIAGLYCYCAEFGMAAGAGALVIETRNWMACRARRKLAAK